MANSNETIDNATATGSSTDAAAQPQQAEQPQRELSTKEAYFISLNNWVKNANISQNAMSMFPWYLLSSYPQMFQQQAVAAAAAGNGLFSMSPTVATAAGLPAINANNINNNNNNARLRRLGLLDEQTQAEMINRSGGYEYIIAPFWKRAVAEFIDMCILLLLKVMFTFLVMNIFDLDLGFDLDKETLRKAIDDDDYAGFLAVSWDFVAFSSDFLILEVLTKVIVCVYEGLWVAAYEGATPGKAMMNLRVKYVEAVLALPPPAPTAAQQQQQQQRAQAAAAMQPVLLGFNAPRRVPLRAILYPAATPGFKRSFVRAIAKNMVMTLLFPMCFIMIFFKNNRTIYDILTKSIVVEHNPNPVQRRPV